MKKIIWLNDKKRFYFNGIESIDRLEKGYHYQEMPNVERNGTGNSYFIYLREKTSGVWKKAIRYYAGIIPFFMMGTVSYVNMILGLYGFMNSNTSLIVNTSIIGILVMDLLMVVYGYVRISSDKTHVDSWKARIIQGCNRCKNIA